MKLKLLSLLLIIGGCTDFENKKITEELIAKVNKLEAFRDSCQSLNQKRFKVGVEIGGKWFALRRCPVWVIHRNGKPYDMENGHSLTPGEEQLRITDTPTGLMVKKCDNEDNIPYEWR